MTITDMAHLHLHSEKGSLLDGITKISDSADRKGLVSRVKELGMSCVAVTDHGSMSGIPELYEECSKQGIGAIVGTELYVIDGDTTDPENLKQKGYHLILLAKSTIGYRNLMALNTYGALHAHGKFPKIDFNVLRKHKQDVIILTACAAGQVYQEFLHENYERGEQLVTQLKEMFNDDFYLEIQDTDLTITNKLGKPFHQKEVNQKIINIANKYQVQCVATGDAHYLYKEDSAAHEVALAIAMDNRMSDPIKGESDLMHVKSEDKVRYRMAFKDKEYYVKSRAEMAARFEDKYLDVTLEIAAKCCHQDKNGNWISNVHINMPNVNKEDKYLMPKLDIANSLEFFLEEVEKGFKLKYGDPKDYPTAKARLDEEVAVITKMNFHDYFLVIADMLNWAKSQNIPCGIGRGSGAGSIVCYCLNITGVCPLKYDLLFSRFLNPERISMPDLDIDIGTKRRHEVFDYITRKYGHEYTARIGTYTTQQAKSILHDLERVYKDNPELTDENFPKFTSKDITDLVESKRGITDDLAELLNKPDFKAKYGPYIDPTSDQYRPLIAKIFDIAKILENNTRNMSKHAAGIVISSEPIANHCPLAHISHVNKTHTYVTQYDMSTLERIGLIKIDVLGLSTLDLIYETLELIKERTGTIIDINNINLDCPIVYKWLNDSDAYEGLFQINSQEFKRMFKSMQPRNIHDFAAGSALFRPGALDSGATYQYCENRRTNNPSTSTIKEIIPILEKTQGLLIYQESIQHICQIVAGWTLAGADVIRKCISKKDTEKLKSLREKFVNDACIKLPHYDKKEFHELFDDIEKFGTYAFNASHSYVYGVTSYQTAWLKTHFPTEFACALMNNCDDKNDYEDLLLAIEDAEKQGIKVVPPDINKSTASFVIIDENTIAYGLGMIKSLSEKHIIELIKARETEGAFIDFKDFCIKCNLSIINKTAIEKLIKAGAFDNIEKTNKAILLNILDDLSITWRIPASSKTGDPKRKIQSSIIKLAKKVQEGLLKPEELVFYEFEDYSLEYHNSINGSNMSEQECLARRVKVKPFNLTDEINMEIEVMVRSFKTLAMDDIPKHLIPATFPETSTKNINNILKVIRRKTIPIANEDMARKNMSTYYNFTKMKKFDIRDEILDLTTFKRLNVDSANFEENVANAIRNRLNESYFCLVYAIFKKLKMITYGPAKRPMYKLEITNGRDSLELVSFYENANLMVTDIQPGDRILLHCVKGMVLRNGVGKVLNYTWESIIKVTELSN